jgi:hypothetical protein
VQFKIIDFGVAKLSEKLAQAAGGRRALVGLGQLGVDLHACN